MATKTRRKTKTAHSHKRIAIKSADVDEKMVPIVKWLNSHSAVWTHYCCQGKRNVSKSPYVFFSCQSIETITAVIQLTNLEKTQPLSDPLTIKLGLGQVIDR